MAVITAGEVKQHLLGVTQCITEAAAQEGFDEADFYASAISAAEAEFERDTRILLTPRTIRMDPDGSEEYDLTEDPLDLHRAFSKRSVRFHLRRRPVIEILRMRFAFSGDYKLLDFPDEWLRINHRMGTVQIAPYGATGVAAASAGGLMYLPHMGYWSYPGGVIPRFVAIDYRAGYDAPEDDDDYADLCDGLRRMAAERVLRRARSIVPNSVSLDGFSQNFDAVQQRLDDLEKQKDKFVQKYKHRERSMVVGVL
jgi:hypothetical protein